MQARRRFSEQSDTDKHATVHIIIVAADRLRRVTEMYFFFRVGHVWKCTVNQRTVYGRVSIIVLPCAHLYCTT